MKTIGDQGEATCPLCMQEMDLTDQQLNPCKCGYQICVWCWHHVIEMAEKDDGEARCPACRSPYDKERIMAMTISRERLSEIKSVKKQKVQKEKSKPSDTGEDFSIVRVIRRNLVYIIGIPAKLADEKILRKKEFLGQYGKVTRIIIIPPLGGNQSFSSNSYYSVFATFAKVEEALRCIQVVNGYTLAGQPLKACFGATRYCNSWLKNLPCRNPNCIYLHDAGSQEDTCTKDEVYAACSSKLQQYPRVALDNFQRRSGSCLPPPADNFSHNSIMTSKPLIELVDNNSLDHGKNNHLNGDGGKLGVHSAATSWSSKLTSGKPSYASVAVNKVPTNPSSRPRNSFLSSSAVEAHIPAKLDVQNSKQVVTAVHDILLSNGHVEKLTSSKPYYSNGYLKHSGEPNFKAAAKTDIVKEDTPSVPSFVYHKDNVAGSNTLPTKSSDSNVNKRLLSTSPFGDSTGCSTVDTVKQVPLGILHSTTMRRNSYSGCLDSSTDIHFSSADYSGTPSINTPNLDSRTCSSNMDPDSYLNSTSEDGVITDTAREDSGEESIISNILSLIDLDDHLADPHGQRKWFADANKKDDCSNMFDSQTACNSHGSRSSFARMDDANHTRMQSPALDANVSGLKTDFKLPGIAEKNASNEYYSNNSVVLRSNHSLSTSMAYDGSQVFSLQQSDASPVSRLEMYPAHKYHLQSLALSKPPPGFPPRHPTGCNSSCMPSSSGSAQPQFSTSAPYLNSCEKMATNNNNSDPHLSYFATIRGKIPQQSSQYQISSNCSSSLMASSDANHCVEFLNSRSLMDQSKTKNIALQEAMMNFDGSERCHMDSLAARESGIACRSGNSRLTEITNSGRISFSNSRFGFLVPSPKHDDSKFQMSNSGYFYSTPY